MASPQEAVNAEEKDTITASPNADNDSREDLKGINERALIRKLDYKLLPALTFLYLLSFLDRSNVGNARIEGLTEDLNMTGNQYLTGLTLFFVGYVLFEVPCNIVMKVWTPRLWLPTLTLAWGVVTTLQGVTQSLTGFLIVRFFLGVAESGLFPGIVFYLSFWYRRAERQYRVALFFGAAAVAGAFGGVLAWGIAHMDGVGNYGGWRWIFILEGLLTVVVAFAAYFFIHNYPSTARFLKDDEREFIQRRLAADSDAMRDEAFTWANVSKAFFDIKVYLYCFGFHTMSLPLYTLSLFLPSIIQALGYTAAQAQLLTVPPYAIAFIVTIVFAVLSERFEQRGPFIVLGSSIAIIGYIILITDHRAGVSYVGTIFAAAGIYPAVALTLAWPANNVSGQTKRAVAGGMQISIGNLGAVLGTQLYRTETAPRYYLGHSFALGYLVANIIVTSVTWWLLRRENARRDKGYGAERLQGINPAEEWLGDDDPRWRFYQ